MDGVSLRDKPAFIVYAADGKTYEIYRDGRISGFGSDAVIINRIPLLEMAARD